MAFSDCYRHHYLHACSAYYPSPFDEAAILTIDCEGVEDGVYECQDMWYGRGTDIEKVSAMIYDDAAHIYGIGATYNLHARFTGLEEGSLMGLAGYGDPERFRGICLYDYDGDEVRLSRRILDAVTFPMPTETEPNTWWHVVSYLERLYGVTPEDYASRNIDITRSIFADIAAKVQHDTEIAVVYLANRLAAKVPSKNLCIAGGVGLNILANTRILAETTFERIYVQPATNDGGISLGAALYGHHVLGSRSDRVRLSDMGVGRAYTEREIRESLDRHAAYLTRVPSDDVCRDAARLLDDGHILGWFSGGMEMGPRALGHRSILAAPRSTATRDRVNAIKDRQWWRPLALAIIEAHASEYLATATPSPHMTLSSIVREELREEIAGVVHVDGQTRYQTVSPTDHPRFHRLLECFRKMTGIPAVINTSFNVKRQPIVESPDDAIATFLSTDLDALVIGDTIVRKDARHPEFEFDRRTMDLMLNFADREARAQHVKHWQILRRLLLRDCGDMTVDFVYTESGVTFNNPHEFLYGDRGFTFRISSDGRPYHIFVGMVEKNQGYYDAVGDVGVRVETGHVGQYHTALEAPIIRILDSMVQRIGQEYAKVYALITVTQYKPR